MNLSKAEQKQIENEMIFRRMNEKVGTELGELDAMHVEDGNLNLLFDDTLILQFKCECSDEDCTTRIPLRLSEYQDIHVDRNTFIIQPNHEVDAIEEVILRKPDYSVVKKDRSTPEPNDTLKITDIDNSQV